jgi:hypothetical protein
VAARVRHKAFLYTYMVSNRSVRGPDNMSTSLQFEDLERIRANS